LSLANLRDLYLFNEVNKFFGLLTTKWTLVEGVACLVQNLDAIAAIFANTEVTARHNYRIAKFVKANYAVLVFGYVSERVTCLGINLIALECLFVTHLQLLPAAHYEIRRSNLAASDLNEVDLKVKVRQDGLLYVGLVLSLKLPVQSLVCYLCKGFDQSRGLLQNPTSAKS
jgi:hypothetical protein